MNAQHFAGGEATAAMSGALSDLDRGRVVVLTSVPGGGLSHCLQAIHGERVAEARATGKAAALLSRGSVRRSTIRRLSWGPDASGACTGELADLLERLDADLASLDSVFVDDVHRLDPGDTAALLDAVLAWTMAGVPVCLGVQPVYASPELVAMLGELPGRAEHAVAPMTATCLDAVFGDLPLDDTSRAWLEAVVSGGPARARALRSRLGALSRGRELTPNDVEGACRDQLMQDVRRAFRIAPSQASGVVLLTWLSPLEPAPSIASCLGIDDVDLVAARSLCHGLGLLTEHPGAARLMRSAVAGVAVEQFPASTTAALVEAMTRLGLPVPRLLEARTALRQHDRSYFDLAVRAVDHARQAGDATTVATIARQVLADASDPRRIRWARRMMFENAVPRDWQGVADCMEQRLSLTDPMTSDEVLSVVSDLSPLFALEEPRLVAQLAARAHQARSLSGLPAQERIALSRLVMLLEPRHWEGLPVALMREAVRDVRHEPLYAAVVGMRSGFVDRRLDPASLSTTPGAAQEQAGFRALAHLTVDNASEAHVWATLAASNASEGRPAERGFGLLLAAQAQVMRDRPVQAVDAARQAVEVFESLGARRLSLVAKTVIGNAVVRRGSAAVRAALRPDETTAWAALLEDPAAHGVARACAAKACAAVAMHEGQPQRAVDLALRAGRILNSAGIVNPFVIDWRGALIGMLGAVGETEMASWAERDRALALETWAARNPDAAQRREQRVPNSEALSKAERRIVSAVVRGMTNREVAAELFLSKRTVDTHLRNIYRKLRISSREELCQLVSSGPGAGAVGPASA